MCFICFVLCHFVVIGNSRYRFATRKECDIGILSTWFRKETCYRSRESRIACHMGKLYEIRVSFFHIIRMFCYV